MSEAYVFNDEAASERWLFLNRSGERMPSEPMEIESCVKHTAKDGSACPKFTLLNKATHERYVMIAWDRDVKACKEQWGNNPANWEDVIIAKDATGKYRLLPAPMSVIEEVVA